MFRSFPQPKVLARSLLVGALLVGSLAGAGSIGTLFRAERVVQATGAATAQSANYSMVGTAGQLAPGEVASDAYRVGSGFWTGGDASVTAVEPDPPARGRVHRLDQNHPNPFNPTTTIRFALPRAAHTQLALFDSRGRRVQTLIDETRTAGEHEIVLDARNLSSGVYWYRLQSGSFSATRQMVLVK